MSATDIESPDHKHEHDADDMVYIHIGLLAEVRKALQSALAQIRANDVGEIYEAQPGDFRAGRPASVPMGINPCGCPAHTLGRQLAAALAKLGKGA